MRVVGYVTGHGFGHAVRAAELSRALAARGAEVVLRSDARPEAFAPLPAGVRLEPVTVDAGAVQRSALEVDEAATLDRLEALERDWPERLAAEVAVLRALGAAAVFADIAPLGIAAGRAAGLPAVLVANFTWDWIYAAWADREPRARAAARWLRQHYAQATVLLAPALAAGLPSPPPNLGIPLIVRRARRPRDEIRRALGLRPQQAAVLVAFGGFGPPPLASPVDVDPDRWRFFGFSDLGWPAALYRRVTRSDFEHPELVAAADVLIGKPGYGTVAECAAHHTPMLWLGRERFAEVEVLARGIAEHVGGVELPPEAARTGRLRAWLEAAMTSRPAGAPLATDGAEVAAGHILALAAGGGNGGDR